MDIIFKVDGMMCHHCEARAEKAVKAVAGVENAVASFEKGTLSVSCGAEVSEAQIINAIEAQGYKVIV